MPWALLLARGLEMICVLLARTQKAVDLKSWRGPAYMYAFGLSIEG
jgi:hypothetical protein